MANVRPLIKCLIVLSLVSIANFSFAEVAKWSTESDDKRFIVTIYPSDSEIPIGDYHQWIARIEDKFGSPLEHAKLAVDGGMPAHGHGLPSQPLLDSYLGDGEYLIVGMLFNMAGEWALRFSIQFPGGSDMATFSLTLTH